MGQYYKIAIKKGDDIFVANPSDMDEGVKLMEHSYVDCEIMKAVGKFMFKSPIRLSWVGDYADDSVAANTHGQLNYDDVHGENCGLISIKFPKVAFDFKGLYFVNHDKKCYLPFDESIFFEDDFRVCPISILTAIGNGQGGGDYFGKNSICAGTWTWDLVSIESEPPSGYKHVTVKLNEDK